MSATPSNGLPVSGTATPASAQPPASSASSQHSANTLPPLDKSGHYGNYSDEQKALLTQFEKQLADEGLVPEDLQKDPEQKDIHLGRFLRARTWNLEDAKKMYKDTLAWRKEVDIDQLRKPKEEGGYDFSEREKVAELGWKMYFHATDKYHRPIFVQDLSNIQINEVFVVTTADRIVRFFACKLEDAVRNKYRTCTQVARDEARANGVSEEEAQRIIVDDNFMILNIAGLGMGTFWSFKTKLQQLLGILDANYPELSGRVQIVNAPWLFSTIWSYIKPWLPVNTVAKIDIAGTDFAGALLPFIDAHNLPKSLGGTCECDVPGGCAFSDRGPWRKEAAEPALEKVTDGETTEADATIATAGV